MKQKVLSGAKTLSKAIIEGLKEKKGLNLISMNLQKVDGAICDYFIIATGTSDRHVQALADSALAAARAELEERPLSKEGYQQGEWILLDYVNVIVHIFLNEKREFYNIEELWGDAKFEKFKDEA